QSRQAVPLLEGLHDEPTLEVDFIPHNPRLPRLLRKLEAIRYLRTIVRTPFYLAILLFRLHRFDIVHVFSAAYYAYLLCAMPAILIGKMYGRVVILNYRSGEAEDHMRRWTLTGIPTMRLADAIVVPSGYLVEVFARFGLRAYPIFNIVELDRFRFR